MSKQRRTAQTPDQKQSSRSHAARKSQARAPVADASTDSLRLQRVADHAESASAGDVMSLQTHYGNRAVQRLLASHTVQAKLAVGPAHDRYEQEADQVAARVMSAPARAQTGTPAASGAVQAMPVAAGVTPLEAQREADEEDAPSSSSAPASAAPLAEPPSTAGSSMESTSMATGPSNSMPPMSEAPGASQSPATPTGTTTSAPGSTTPAGKVDDSAPATTTAPAAGKLEEDSALQAKFEDDRTAGFDAGPTVERQLAGTQGQGAPLPNSLRAKMETGIGADFGAVRVHTGGDAVQLNRSLQAQAFTHGSDVYMGAGKYNPGSADGQRLLAHELTHVVQQGAAQPAVRREPSASPTGDSPEQEAEQLGGQILRKSAAEDEENPA